LFFNHFFFPNKANIDDKTRKSIFTTVN